VVVPTLAASTPNVSTFQDHSSVCAHMDSEERVICFVKVSLVDSHESSTHLFSWNHLSSLKICTLFYYLFVWACLLLECQRYFSFKNISCTFCYSVECCMMLKSLSICVLIRCFCGKCFQGSYLKLLLRPWHLKMASCQVHLLFESLISWYVALFFIHGLSSFQGHFETFMIAATTFLSCVPMTFCLCFIFTCLKFITFLCEWTTPFSSAMPISLAYFHWLF